MSQEPGPQELNQGAASPAADTSLVPLDALSAGAGAAEQGPSMLADETDASEQESKPVAHIISPWVGLVEAWGSHVPSRVDGLKMVVNSANDVTEYYDLIGTSRSGWTTTYNARDSDQWVIIGPKTTFKLYEHFPSIQGQTPDYWSQVGETHTWHTIHAGRHHISFEGNDQVISVYFDAV